jgi:hypothetical protein
VDDETIIAIAPPDAGTRWFVLTDSRERWRSLA